MICFDFKKISTDELIEYVLEWHERSKIKLKRSSYFIVEYKFLKG